MNKWQRYRLKDLKAYRERKREYATTPDQRKKRTAYMRIWREKNREKHNKQANASHHRNKHKHVGKLRNRHLLKNYGITTLQKIMMIGNQKGRCGICDSEFVFTRDTHLDHCHRTGVLRGILCHICNTKLAWYEEHYEAIGKYVAGSCMPTFGNDSEACKLRISI